VSKEIENFNIEKNVKKSISENVGKSIKKYQNQCKKKI